MNQAFTEPVVTAAPGGSGGGDATLTPFGAEVLERYRSVHERAAAMAVDEDRLLEMRNPGRSGNSAASQPEYDAQSGLRALSRCSTEPG